MKKMLAGTLLVLALSGCAGTPLPASTVTETAVYTEVEVPNSCLLALSAADELTEIFATAMDFSGDAMLSASVGDWAGVEDAADGIREQTDKINNSQYPALRDRCREEGEK